MQKFVYSDKKLKKFFDLDENGVTNAHEAALIATQKRFGWPLVTSKKRKQYDFDLDHMLSSYEYHLYKKGQKNKDAQYRPVPIRQ